MSARSRKRGRRTRPARAGAQAAAPDRASDRQRFAGAQAPPTATTPRRTRSEQRNEAVRATLTPLAPGERPWALRIAVVLAVLVALGDLAQVAIGTTVKLGHTHTNAAGVLLFSVVMLACAVGMWQLRYWAVLGFQALLALVIIAFALVLITANDILRALASVAIIGLGGWLFFKLVRVLSRLQMPRPGNRG